jgi:hypothetical protein
MPNNISEQATKAPARVVSTLLHDRERLRLSKVLQASCC